MNKYFIALLVIFMTLATASNINAKNNEKAELLRETVWNWELEAFKNYSVPEKYKDESIIILAYHQQIDATSKNKFRMAGLFFGDVNKELFCTDINRYLIKLNDKKALEKYSELSFVENTKVYGFMRSNKMETVVGVRIIKPDGTIREIDVDEDAVAITEGKKDKETSKQIAIRGLEVGDILDYFYIDKTELETFNMPAQVFAFFNQYPVLSYSVECIFGDNLTVEYKSLNGAPDFEVSTDVDKNVILKASQKDLKITSDISEHRWVSGYRDFPMIRLLILNNASKLIDKPASARKKGLYKDVSYEDILNDRKGELSSWHKRMFWMGNVYKKTNVAITNYRQNNSSASNEQLATYVYDALRFYWPNNQGDFPFPKFFIALEKLMKENNIESQICFTTSKMGPRKEELVESDDLSIFLAANNGKQFFFFPNRYRMAGEISSAFAGEPVSAVSVLKYKSGSPIGIEGEISEFILPTSSAEDNKNTVKSEVRFSDKNPLELTIKRQVVSSGAMKDDWQNVLVLFEDWDKAMRKNLLIETDFWQDIESDKDSRKYADKYKAFFDEQRDKQKELIKAEFQEYHASSSGELVAYSINSLGVTPDAPTFELETEYNIDGLVREAGNNLLLDVGRLIGSQWKPTDKERKREWNAYIPYALSIDNEVVLHIPVEYTAGGIENLNMSIDNKYGSFTSVATLNGNLLTINTSKVYKQDFVPHNEWNTFLEMMDVANQFCEQVLMLKRN